MKHTFLPVVGSRSSCSFFRRSDTRNFDSSSRDNILTAEKDEKQL